METFKLSLNSIEKVGEFVKKISKYDGSLDIAAGRYSVDARSLMGILSIDLNRVLELKVPGSDIRIWKHWKKTSSRFWWRLKIF